MAKYSFGFLSEKVTEKPSVGLQSQISTIISTALYLEGKSSYGSRLCKNYALCVHELVEPYSAAEAKLHLGGSNVEGTATLWSDADGMKVLPNVTVCDERTMKDCPSGNILLMETKQCRPGLTRLIPFKLVEDPADAFSSIVENADGLFKINEDALTYISSQIFADYFVSVHATIVTDIPTHYKHGPCATALQDMKEYAVDNLESDMAHALRCDKWPLGAQEWFTRDRRNEWPPKETIEIIQQQDCHVVPVGDPTSEFVSEEWRISFLLSERELVWSFNDTQLQCYYILKCLLKNELDSLAPDQLSSYHLKTIMFWQCENSHPNSWNAGNLLECVKACLTELRLAIEKKHLEHFFDKRNLFSTKFEKSEEAFAVMDKIKVLLNDIITPVMQNIQYRGILDAWNCSQNLTTFVMVCEFMVVDKVKKQADFRQLCDILQKCFIQYAYYIRYPQIGTLLKNIRDNVEIGRVDETFAGYMKHFLELRTGIELGVLEKITDDKSRRMSMHNDAQELITEGSKFNAISGKLFLATFHYCDGAYTSSCSVLNDIWKHFTNKEYYYAGLLSSRTSIQIDKMGYAEEGDITPCPENSDPVNGAVFDVVVSSRDLPTVPYALKFECAMLSDRTLHFFFLHPVVYFYFLMFLNEMCMGNYFRAVKSLLCLEKAVKDMDHPVRTFREMNLLGYCFAAVGEYAEAFECYRQSFQKYPSERNAAVYHSLILIRYLITKWIYEPGRLSAISTKVDNFCDILFALLHTKPLLKNKMLKGISLLTWAAHSFLLEYIFFQKRNTTILAELPLNDTNRRENTLM